MTLKDRMVSDMGKVFLNANAFAETIVYYPGGDKTAPKTIKAVVNRDEVEPFDDQLRHQIEITISRDPVAGIENVDKGHDKCLCPIIEGGDPVPLRVVNILSQDAGAWTLGVST